MLSVLLAPVSLTRACDVIATAGSVVLGVLELPAVT
jgi:hypothetical protein